MAFTAHKMYKRRSCICTDSQARSAAASAPNTEVHQDAEDLHYAALRATRPAGQEDREMTPRLNVFTPE
ncbi:hypothetical protein INR49_027962 [Caranx melampygus]|nr:hypothetical protein INR49_027962 [Caranx melampygus]